jgi:hypothetical protein
MLIPPRDGIGVPSFLGVPGPEKAGEEVSKRRRLEGGSVTGVVAPGVDVAGDAGDEAAARCMNYCLWGIGFRLGSKL